MRTTELKRAKFEQYKFDHDNHFEWTQERLEKLRALNNALLEAEKKTIAMMQKTITAFKRIEEERCPFLHDFKILGQIFFEKAILLLDEEEKAALPEETRKSIEKWYDLSRCIEDSYWRLVYDCATGDFLPLSKMFLNENLYCWDMGLPDDCDIKICNYLCALYTYNPALCLEDLLDCSAEDFLPDVSARKGHAVQKLYEKNSYNSWRDDGTQELLAQRSLFLDKHFEWSEQNIQKMFKVNEIVWSRTNQAKEEMRQLGEAFLELAKTDPFFAEFDIDAELQYQSQKPTDIATVEMQKKLTERTYSGFLLLRFYGENGVGDFRDARHDDENLNWNFEVYAQHFNEEQKKVRFHYFMHCIFIDGQTYSFEDLIRMEEDGFVLCYAIDFCNW